MPKSDRREQHRDELRTKILDAARDLFLEEGIDKVSMRKIAVKVNYSATNLYKYFADKDALLVALCEEDFLSLRKGFERIAKVQDPLERLRKLGMAYVEFALKHPSHYRLMFMTPHIHGLGRNTPAIQQGNPEQDAYAFLRSTVAAAIEAGLFREEYADADHVAQVVWSGVHGVVALHLVMGRDEWIDWSPVKTVARSVVDVMIDGMSRR